MYTKMKRKVAKGGKLRLSPNEEALLLKEDYERRRRLRLQQVREQERHIALQIRQEVKQRRDEQLQQLAEELKAEWWKAQNQKIKVLEKLYLSSLRAVGEGHRQAKDHEPDLVALAKQAEERKQRAEKRHKEALKEQKIQKEKLLEEQTWRTSARKHALYVEKKRAAKIASLPPPPPHPFENFEVKRMPMVKVYNADNFSVTHHHLSEPYVDREMDIKQTDARLAAEEEAKRLEELQKEEERERREQLEKAHLRGNHALKMVHLTQDRERLMKELEQMQNVDLARRKQIVAKMPPQLFEPAYRRVEIKEDWQRELEFAFEDMYCGGRKMKGDTILHLEPQPLPNPCDRSQDEDLDISLEAGAEYETQSKLDEVVQKEDQLLSEPEIWSLYSSDIEEGTASQPQSKLVLKKLLNKIRSQKDQWTSKCEADIRSEIETIESGTLASEERRLCDSDPGHEQCADSASQAVESPAVEHTVVAGNSVLIHPQEQATKIRMEIARQKEIEQIEQQKQHQLILLKQIEEKRLCLQSEFLKVQMQAQQKETKKIEQEEKTQHSQLNPNPLVSQQKEVEHKTETAALPEASSSKEENHIQVIHNYQQYLLQQNRLHRQSVEEARKQLQEYQDKLKQRYPSISMPLSSAVTLQSRFMNLQPTARESVLQMHELAVLHNDHPSADKSSVQVHVQEYAQPLATHSRTHFVLEEPFELRDDEQRHTSNQLQSIDASELDKRQFKLPQQTWSSQEQMETLGASDNQVRELLESQKLPGSVIMTLQDTSVMMQTEAQIQQENSAFSTHESSEAPRTLDLDKKSVMTQKMPNLLRETETQKQSQLTVLDMPAAERSLLTQAALFEASEYQQVPAKSSIKTTFEQIIPHPFQHPISLSPDESEVGAFQESLASRREGASLLNYSSILKLRERVLASSESIQAQQDHLKELQEQLDVQREALLSRQRMQEELLLCKQAKLKQQMQRQQEALQDFLNKRTEEPVTYRQMTETQKSDHFNLMPYLLKDAESKSQEVHTCGDMNKYVENRLLSQSINQAEQIEQSQRILGREQRGRTSKPPLAKIKLGLDLEQHELSAIPEQDTPRSDNISFTDRSDSVGGEASLISSVEELVSGICNSESVHDRRDLSIANCAEWGSSENLRCSNQLHSSWYEGLMVDAGSSHNSANLKDSVVMRQDLPIFATDTGKGVITDSGPSFRPGSMVALSKGWSTSFAPQACVQEVVCDYSSSTTISTGSFLPSEKLDVSPTNTGLSSDSAEDRLLRETASSPWDSSTFPIPTTAQQRQENSSEASEFHQPAKEHFISSRSQVQQIIDRYTKDLNWFPENSVSFHEKKAPVDEFNFSDTDKNLPNFQHQLFQPLEPRSSFDISSSLSQPRISQDSKDFKISAFSTQSQNTPVFPEATTSSLKTRSYNLHSRCNTNKLNNTTSLAEESRKEIITLGSEDSFHPLQLESTLNEHSQSTEQPIGLHVASEQNSKIKKSETEDYISPLGDQYEELTRNTESTNFLSSIQNLQSATLSPLEEQGSVHQLTTAQTTENETLLTEQSVEEVVEVIKENLCFEELPVGSSSKHKKLTETPVLRNEANRIVEGDCSQCSTSILDKEQIILEEQMSCRIPTDMESEISVSPLQTVIQQNIGLPETPQNQNSNSELTISSGSRSSQSLVPVWETETGHGIMEEPDLTLLSSDDISVAESESEHVSQEKKRTNKLDSLAYIDQAELKSSSEGREFLSLKPQADYSVSTLLDSSEITQSPNEDQSPLHQSAVMLLEFTSTPCSLQESFLKKKKSFIEKSSKRVEEIKNGERSSKKPQIKLLQRDKTKKFHLPKEHSPTSGAVVSQLKKVGEVIVCSPEDRKSAGVQMQQRTLRLYNQLAEVKSRKEEKSRQETCAKNRKKAKEFQKKTLEKLRAKKTH